MDLVFILVCHENWLPGLAIYGTMDESVPDLFCIHSAAFYVPPKADQKSGWEDKTSHLRTVLQVSFAACLWFPPKTLKHLAIFVISDGYHGYVCHHDQRRKQK